MAETEIKDPGAVNIHLLLDRDAARKIDALTGPHSTYVERLRARQRWIQDILASRLKSVKASPDPLESIEDCQQARLTKVERDILHMHLAGHSYNSIARKLNEGNIPSARNGVWRHRTVQIILDRLRKQLLRAQAG